MWNLVKLRDLTLFFAFHFLLSPFC